MGFRKLGFERVYWIKLAQNRGLWQAVANTVMKRRVPFKTVSFVVVLIKASDSEGRTL
jgi:hypothetical protein